MMKLLVLSTAAATASAQGMTSRVSFAVCAGSPTQTCRMMCPQLSCPRGQCAMRVGGCCSMTCQAMDGGHSLGGAGRPGAGSSAGSEAFNCCGGGTGCGFTHCPALGAGQDGCVRPWALPAGMTLDQCAVAPAPAPPPSTAVSTNFDCHAALRTELDDINRLCCSVGDGHRRSLQGECVGLAGRTCSAECAALWMPLWDNCRQMANLDQIPGATNFQASCQAASGGDSKAHEPVAVAACTQGADCGGQTWTDCGSSCAPICGEPQAMMCNMMCNQGYQCPSGLSWNRDTTRCERCAMTAPGGMSGGMLPPQIAIGRPFATKAPSPTLAPLIIETDSDWSL